MNPMKTENKIISGNSSDSLLSKLQKFKESNMPDKIHQDNKLLQSN